MNMVEMNMVEWHYILEKITKEITDLGGKSVDMYVNNGSIVVTYEMDGNRKCFCFDLGNYERASNVFDNIYNGSYFLKSYLINGKVRAFVGKMNRKNHTISPIAFDINKKQYTRLIINKDGFIDENEMVNLLEKENGVIGFDQEEYNEIEKHNILSVLYNLNIKNILTPYVMRGIDTQIKEEKERVYAK